MMSALRLRIAALVVLSLAVILPTLSAQSEMVIVKERTEYYHRPTCAIVRDGRNVLVMSRAQAEARGYKSDPDCDPSNRAASAPATTPLGREQRVAPPPPAFVYVDGGKYYHRQDCRNLGTVKKKTLLEEAGRKYWPCPTCRPPVRKKAEGPAVRIRRG
jgi:hypothetical protein